MILPEPKCFGLPQKFTQWRPYQDEAIWGALNTERRFYTCVAPIGAGKSVGYVTTAILKGGRSVILTSTKSLQTQLMRDFSSIGMVDIRGRNAYQCRLERDGTTCDHGACVVGIKCDLKSGGCDYFDALSRAKSANLIVTNYACWMTQLQHGKGFGDVGMLICDEAHDAPNMLDSFLTVDFSRKNKDIREFIPDGDLGHFTLDDWKSWAKARLDTVNEELEWLMRHIRKDGGNRSARRRLSVMKAARTNLETVSNMSDEWVFETDEDGVRFSPTWPAAYAESKLFNNISKLILTSGSIRPKTLEILGIESENSEIVEYPHTFPVERRPIYHIPTVRLNRYTRDDQLKVLTVRVDQIIRNRQDRKGIIHTISYKRRDYVKEHSEFSNIMMTNKRGNAEFTLSKFLRSSPPSILISPSIMTGIDLPHSDCRFQIILKVPYPSTQGAVMKARTERDPGYSSYIAAQNMTQAYGRPNRAEDDFSETFVVDDSIVWFLKKYADYVPQYFHDAFQTKQSIPSPPRLDEIGG